MKNKKLLLILIAVVAVIIVVVVVMASVFSVKQIDIKYHSLDGGEIIPSETIDKNEALDLIRGKSIVFLSKNKTLEQFNAKYTSWHAFAVVKNFPNAVDIHVVELAPVAKLDVNNVSVYVDMFGYVMEVSEGAKCIDITSAFSMREVKTVEAGHKLEFNDSENNARFEQVLQAISATWQCFVDYQDIPSILGSRDVFTYEENALVLNTIHGAKIKVQAPQTKLTEKLIQSFSVYYNSKYDLQKAGVIINVSEDGKISSNGKVLK